MFLSEWLEFPSAPCLARQKNLTARISMSLKSRASLTCFRACFLPGRATDLSAPQYNNTHGINNISFLVGWVQNTATVKHLRFSERFCWRFKSSGMWLKSCWVNVSDVSDEPSCSMFRAKQFRETTAWSWTWILDRAPICYFPLSV